ncbi:MAG: PilT/PilU family type 4a pilus ATPase [Phycisphaerae bacterium]|jgi:twitching motility protein PilT|nr:PilT/PilU family type 4a pilus ATPase [Phycisphaerae bacterium]
MQNVLPDSIIPLLEKMRELQASDLHLKTGIPPTYRVAGDLRRTNLPPIQVNSRLIERLMDPIIPKARKSVYDETGGLDFAYNLPNGDRFRINILRSCDQMHAAIRRVKGTIPSFEELRLPPIYRKLADEAGEGIIIVCGVTGCGKSTTQAAMIDHINETQALNIVSIEDPIEYSFASKKSIVSQRELGLDVHTFADALRGAVRQDPDVIFIGETRDRETLVAALQAAETGHLVFCTLHTADTMQALTRILEFFPPDQHTFVRSSLANGLKAILAQRLLPASDPKISRVPACEVLLGEGIVKEKIRAGEDTDLPEIILGSKESGMRNFTMSLADLIEQGLIFADVAMEYAPNREALKGMMQGIKTSAQTLVHRVKRTGAS